MDQRDALEELVSDLQIQAGTLDVLDNQITLDWFWACAQVLAALRPELRESQLSTFAILAVTRALAAGYPAAYTTGAANTLRVMTEQELWRGST